MLTRAQSAALAHVAARARERAAGARSTIDDILEMSNVPAERLAELLALIQTSARVALHFHPDRLDARGVTVAASLLECGVYRSQFETAMSAGSLTATRGGARDTWEERMFGGAYQLPETTLRERPKYGALDLLGHSDGPAPRFGSCYLILHPAVSERATFTYRDSHLDPRERGTIDAFDDVLAGVLSDTFSSEQALGEKDLRPPEMLERITRHLTAPFASRFARPPARNLDHYIEAQVHGDVSLRDDVDHLVCDPSFRDTSTGEELEQLAKAHAIELHWHHGSTLAVDQIPADFRGPTMPSLARRVAPSGTLDVRLIGEAAADLRQHPASWGDRGTPAECLQELKLLWHVLVRHGRDATNGNDLLAARRS